MIGQPDEGGGEEGRRYRAWAVYKPAYQNMCVTCCDIWGRLDEMQEQKEKLLLSKKKVRTSLRKPPMLRRWFGAVAEGHYRIELDSRGKTRERHKPRLDSR
jgi:hypothetical protein